MATMGLKGPISSLRQVVPPDQQQDFQPIDISPAYNDPIDKFLNKGFRFHRQGDVMAITGIAQGIQAGAYSDAQVEDFMKRNPETKGIIGPIYDSTKNLRQKEQLQQSILAKHFGTQPQSGPTRPGETLNPVPLSDFGGATNELLGAGPGNVELAGKLAGIQKQMQEGKAAGLYGGVQYGIGPKGETKLFAFQKDTGEPVPLSAPEGVTPTIPMVPQQIMLPGGASGIVQMPSRGIPGEAPKVNPTGLTPAQNLTGQPAGMLKMLDQASADMTDAMNLIMPKGKLNKDVIYGMSVPFTAGVGTDSRKAYSAIYNAVAARLRAETGAQANDQEIQDMAKRFVPSVLDSQESAKYKMDRLKEFVNGAYEIVDPNNMRNRIQRGQTKSDKPSTNKVQKWGRDANGNPVRLP